MKSLNKSLLCGTILIIFSIIAQYRFGNNGAWIGGGLVLFSLGLGWYLCKSMQEEELKAKIEGEKEK